MRHIIVAMPFIVHSHTIPHMVQSSHHIELCTSVCRSHVSNRSEQTHRQTDRDRNDNRKKKPLLQTDSGIPYTYELHRVHLIQTNWFFSRFPCLFGSLVHSSSAHFCFDFCFICVSALFCLFLFTVLSAGPWLYAMSGWEVFCCIFSLVTSLTSARFLYI